MTSANHDDAALSIDRLRAVLHGADLWSYAWQPTPTAIDEAIVGVLNAFAREPEAVRESIRDLASEDIARALLAFTQRAATFAIREQSSERVSQGLLALVLQAWLPTADRRDVGYYVLPLTDAARRVGAQDELFHRAAALAPPRHTAEVRSAIPHRGVRGAIAGALFRLLPSTTMRPTMTDEGFRYGRPVRTRAEAEATAKRVNAILDESRKRREGKQ
jgi:hypothetical protein